MKASKRKAPVNGHNGHNGALRDPVGRYLPGHGAPGPGRPPGGPSVAGYLAYAARQLEQPLEAARDAVVIARELSPAALLTAFEIMTDEAADHGNRLAAARFIVERGHGMPTQASAVLNLDASSMTPEQKEQLQARANAALERLRSRYSQPPPTLESDST
jgi:hypothetical protein